eukprot:TRINITY_DN90806_c0_g1_i1.p1 TRINITY_DN90806_c0_g1~~TRINITY_DN90806_c0_g1_i1.p1  ORF type:complete len:352 (-),score=81.99 TRINITY_DN90806_c0_g1_i1:139-1194(-)
MGGKKTADGKKKKADAEAVPASSGNDNSDSSGETRRRACLHRQLHKTKLCTYFLKGACHYGKDCAFAHNCTELQVMPDLRKTRVCKAFQEGSCTDPACAFAHGEEELVSTGLFHKMTLCKWNEKGKCRNGNQCRFAHGAAELRDGKARSAALGTTLQPTSETKQDALSNGVAKAKVQAKEPEPMKVLGSPPGVRVEPGPSSLGSAASALAAAAALGLPRPRPGSFMSWPEVGSTTSSIQALNALRSVHPERMTEATRNPYGAELAKIQMNMSVLMSQFNQIRQKLNARSTQVLLPPELGSSEQLYGAHGLWPPSSSFDHLALLQERNIAVSKLLQPSEDACYSISGEAVGA